MKKNQPPLKTTTVRLAAPEDSWLTMTAACIRSRTGVPVDRSAVLRGVLDGIRLADLDLNACTGETAIRNLVANGLRDCESR